jgi:hypothetical protein
VISLPTSKASTIELAAIQADVGDPVHHEHRRRRKLRIAGTEIAAPAGLEQVLPSIAGLGRVKLMRISHSDATLS